MARWSKYGARPVLLKYSILVYAVAECIALNTVNMYIN
jgi:hypothetical protein